MALFVALSLNDAVAENRPPVAQIGHMTQNIRNTSKVQRSDGRIELASPGMPLFAGDVVQLESCQPSLEIIFAKQGDSRIQNTYLPDPGCMRRIDVPSPPSDSITLDDLLNWLNFIGRREPVPRFVETRSRSMSTSTDMLAAAPAQPRIRLQGTPQMVTTDLADLAVFWDGIPNDAHQLVVRQGTKVKASARSAAGLDSVMRIEQPLQADVPAAIVVSGKERTVLNIPLSVVEIDREPRAPSLKPSSATGDPASLTAQGVWLLLHAGPEWRVQALGRLAQSARVNGDFVAARLLHSVLAGEWAPPR
ncbi:hypothetical protein ABMY26_11495 [Azospirillum sp. HJ39]|uniref:hypothetical protein n=1 Tax=Azospirillum sp. HJ39 TaxID=3159496 RepID=UPI0035562249